jgi:hypothetical protein
MAGYWNNEGGKPTKVTWANPEFVPETKRKSGGWYYNPDSGMVERWWAQGTGPGAQATPTQTIQTQTQSPDAIIQSLKNVVNDAINPQLEAENKLGEYMKKNPFTFDEALAKLSAEERFNPYYDAELKDFLTGVERTRSRTVQDEETLRQELTTQTENYVGRTKRDIDQAITASGEGFSGAGLYASGRRIREGAMIDIKGQENISDTLRKSNLSTQESQLRQSRTLEDLGTQQATFGRRLGAEKETNVLSDIQQQKRDEANQYWNNAIQYAGAPLSSNSETLNRLLGVY